MTGPFSASNILTVFLYSYKFWFVQFEWNLKMGWYPWISHQKFCMESLWWEKLRKFHLFDFFMLFNFYLSNLRPGISLWYSQQKVKFQPDILINFVLIKKTLNPKNMLCYAKIFLCLHFVWAIVLHNVQWTLQKSSAFCWTFMLKGGTRSNQK